MALVSQTPYRNIAEQYGTSPAALSRHRVHIPGALVAARAAVQVASAETLLSQVQGLVARATGILDSAEQAGKLQTALAAIREVRGCLELLGKLSGELRASNGAIAIANAAPVEKIDKDALIERILGPGWKDYKGEHSVIERIREKYWTGQTS